MRRNYDDFINNHAYDIQLMVKLSYTFLRHNNAYIYRYSYFDKLLILKILSMFWKTAAKGSSITKPIISYNFTRRITYCDFLFTVCSKPRDMFSQRNPVSNHLKQKNITHQHFDWKMPRSNWYSWTFHNFFYNKHYTSI